jgi:pyrimidine operon attenuation protein/uracil phosphoribosyltransferase
MKPTVILDSQQFQLTIKRLCFQLIENHDNFENSAIVGLQPRGIYLANRLKLELEKTLGKPVLTGALDITFFRDDFRRQNKPLIPSATNLDFSVEGKRVILVDDVLFSGRTVRAGMEAAMTYGRPIEIELMTLIDRRFKRNIPIQPTYIGKSIDTIDEENVTVNWKETDGKDEVLLFNKKAQ